MLVLPAPSKATSMFAERPLCKVTIPVANSGHARPTIGNISPRD